MGTLTKAASRSRWLRVVRYGFVCGAAGAVGQYAIDGMMWLIHRM